MARLRGCSGAVQVVALLTSGGRGDSEELHAKLQAALPALKQLSGVGGNVPAAADGVDASTEAHSPSGNGEAAG